MKANLQQLEETIETMPIYGILRAQNKELTFGQYLTVLQNWFNSLQKAEEDFKRELFKMFKEILGVEDQ